MADEQIRIYCESLGDGRYLHRPKDPLCACGAVPLFQMTKAITIPIRLVRPERKIDHTAMMGAAKRRYLDAASERDVVKVDSLAELIADFAVEMIRRDRDGAL